MRAPFPYRAFHKPLGYAGDYEMVNMMLRDSREGPTTYAELVNTLILLAGPPQAHRNRIDVLEKWLLSAAARAEQRSAPLKVLNIGCGPAIELQRFIHDDKLASRCHFCLVDFSEEALQYTQQQIQKMVAASHNKPEIDLIHMSVHSLLKNAVNMSEGGIADQYDVIYCAGLFDYLSDRVCNRLLRLFFQWVNPDGGRILATNVHPANDARYQMEHILEWYLVYRDEKAMSALVPEVDEQRTFVDKTGINVFLEIRRQDIHITNHVHRLATDQRQGYNLKRI
jgi:extracellular factor (EF) 3-hydroxypalmitic acid methyl ester biosynthesis protein